MNKDKYNFLIKCICQILFVICLNVVIFYPYKSFLEIFYIGNNSSTYDGYEAQIFWDNGDGYSEALSNTEEISHRLASLSIDEINKGDSIRVDFISDQTKVKLSELVIRNGMFDVAYISAEELYENSTFSNYENIYFEEGNLVIDAQNDLQCQFNEKLSMKICNAKNNKWTRNFMIIFIVALWLLIVLGYITIKKSAVTDNVKLYSIMRLFILVAFILVFIMASFSKLYAHPDEDEIMRAIEYYVNNWKLPDFSSTEVSNSFSVYGTSRLVLQTVYYPIAGKFAWVCKNIFRLSGYFRAFNVFLYAMLILMFWKKMKKSPWVFFLLCPTPQLWYIFSYATADAWDYFLSVLIIYEVVDINSRVNSTLYDEIHFNNLISNILLGILFGLLWLGKTNFKIIFLIAFICFGVKLYEAPKKNRKNLLIRYSIIVFIFGIVTQLRNLIDYVYYGGKKQYLFHVVAEGKKSAEIVEAGLHLRDKGESLWNIWFDRHFLKTSYKSFFGMYGWMTEESDLTYYVLIAVLIIMLAINCKMIIKNLKSFRNYVYFVMAISSIILMLGASTYYAWFIDFQAQGRYILPIIFGFCPFVAENSNYFRSRIKLMRIYFILICIYIYGYSVFGITKLI